MVVAFDRRQRNQLAAVGRVRHHEAAIDAATEIDDRAAEIGVAESDAAVDYDSDRGAYAAVVVEDVNEVVVRDAAVEASDESVLRAIVIGDASSLEAVAYDGVAAALRNVAAEVLVEIGVRDEAVIGAEANEKICVAATEMIDAFEERLAVEASAVSAKVVDDRDEPVDGSEIGPDRVEAEIGASVALQTAASLVYVEANQDDAVETPVGVVENQDDDVMVAMMAAWVVVNLHDVVESLDGERNRGAVIDAEGNGEAANDVWAACSCSDGLEVRHDLRRK